ncbi:hypothetical protein [Exiguobacterium aurantiacum]
MANISMHSGYNEEEAEINRSRLVRHNKAKAVYKEEENRVLY